MAEVNDVGATTPTTESSTEVSTTPTTESSTEVSTTTTSTTTSGNGTEKFDYSEVKKVMDALGEEFKTFSETLKSANDKINESINVSYMSAIYSKSGDGLGAKYLKQWNDNASTFGDFYNNFENWSKLVTLVSINNADFEVTARTTGGTMDGVAALVANKLAELPTEPSGSGIDEVAVFISNHGLINTGAAWLTAFNALSPESQSRINAMIEDATNKANEYISQHGLVNVGAAYTSLDKAVRDIIDKRINENSTTPSTTPSTNPETTPGTEATTETATEAATNPETTPVTSAPTTPPTSAPTTPPTSAPTTPSTSTPTTPPTSTPTTPPTNAPVGASQNDVVTPVTSPEVTLKSGDVVSINGNGYTVYGFAREANGKLIPMYANDSGKLYYLDNNGRMQPVLEQYYTSSNNGYSGGDVTQPATIKSVDGTHAYHAGRGSVSSDKSLVIGNTVIESSSDIYGTACFTNDSLSDKVTILDSAGTPYDGINVNNTVITDGNGWQSYGDHINGIANGNNVYQANSMIDFIKYSTNATPENGVVVVIPKGQYVQWDNSSSTTGYVFSTDNSNAYLMWNSSQNGYQIVDQYGNILNSRVFTLDGFNTVGGSSGGVWK